MQADLFGVQAQAALHDAAGSDLPGQQPPGTGIINALHDQLQPTAAGQSEAAGVVSIDTIADQRRADGIELTTAAALYQIRLDTATGDRASLATIRVDQQ